PRCTPVLALLCVVPASLVRVVAFFFFFLRTRPPPSSTLFPYTTLFRSWSALRATGPFKTNASSMAIAPTTAAVVGAIAMLLAFRSEEHTAELQSLTNLVCRLLLEKKKYAHLSCTPTDSDTLPTTSLVQR